jgi:hypothetical protein
MNVVDVKFLGVGSNIEKISPLAASTISGMIFIAAPLILQSGGQYGVTALHAAEGDIISESIGEDFATISVHHQKAGYFHTVCADRMKWQYNRASQI